MKKKFTPPINPKGTKQTTQSHPTASQGISSPKNDSDLKLVIKQAIPTSNCSDAQSLRLIQSIFTGAEDNH